MSGTKLEAPEWFFMWSTGQPYITSIVGWTRSEVIGAAEGSMMLPWSKIYGAAGE